MKHVYLADRRVPLWWGGRSGAAFRSEAEIAGVGPDANLLSFFRQQVDVQVSLPLTEFTSLHLGAHCGALLPLLGRGWGRGRPQSPISERFFMGGIGNLRGFRFKGVGPSDARKTRPAEEGSSPEQPRRDALGGDLACSSFAALQFALPLAPLQDLNIYGQVFANVGTSALWPGDPLGGGAGRKAMGSLLRDARSSTRVSCGAGLAMPTPPWALRGQLLSGAAADGARQVPERAVGWLRLLRHGVTQRLRFTDINLGLKKYKCPREKGLNYVYRWAIVSVRTSP